MRLSVIKGLTEAAFARTRTLLLPVAAAELLEANVPAVVTSAAGWPRVLAFDDTTEEFCAWSFIVPSNFIASVDPVFKLAYRTPSGGATSGTFAVKVQVMATSDADATGADSYDTANTAAQTVPGTAETQATIAVTLANLDGAVVGDKLILLLSRDVGADSVTGDVQIGDAVLEFEGS